MRGNTTAYLCALLASAVTVAAQDAPRATETKVKSDNGTVVTLIGCVEVGGGTGYALTNITSEREQNGTKPSRATGSYALVERKGLDLGPYIQQKVELTGVVVPAATKGDKDDKIKIKDATKESTTVKVTRGAAPQFLVASVKTLAVTCQP